MKISEVRKTVSQIKAALFKNSNSFSIGMLKSHFKGSGLQFKEHQVYNFGDDIRFIDWGLLAKTSVPFIKTFEEERNVEITVVLDASRSMLSGYEGVSKLQACIEIICLLYLLAKETNDYVHVLVLGDEIINIPKSQGDKGISYLISILEKNKILDNKGKVEIERDVVQEALSSNIKLKGIMKHVGKKREVVVLSDFIDFIDVESLRRLIFRKHLHCFLMEGPLDGIETAKISLFSQGEVGKDNGTFQKMSSFSKRVFPKGIDKKIKRLNVEDRYLESFIKEMM